MYLYRAIDSEGNTIDFYLSSKRDTRAIKRFLKKTLVSCHATKSRVIPTDGDKAYSIAVRELNDENGIPQDMARLLSFLFLHFHKRNQCFVC